MISMSTIITRVSELPGEIAEQELSIPSVGDDLIHPYDLGTGQWQAHCQNGGCGEYIDDMSDVPARDLLCESCETRS